MARFTSFRDMFDGGGAGRSGSRFSGGPVSGLLNKAGAKPASSRKSRKRRKSKPDNSGSLALKRVDAPASKPKSAPALVSRPVPIASKRVDSAVIAAKPAPVAPAPVAKPPLDIVAAPVVEQPRRYTGLLDMVNGGGAGRAGDTFEGGPISGLLNAAGVKPSPYTSGRDLVDGGGAGRSGDTFEGGPLSGFLNTVGVKPLGYYERSEIERPAPVVPVDRELPVQAAPEPAMTNYMLPLFPAAGGGGGGMASPDISMLLANNMANASADYLAGSQNPVTPYGEVDRFEPVGVPMGMQEPMPAMNRQASGYYKVMDRANVPMQHRGPMMRQAYPEYKPRGR